jgi:hypothetical protein
MYGSANNTFVISSSPHSLGLQNNITVPSTWGDSNPLIALEKAALASGVQGAGITKPFGMGTLAFDGTGLFGTGLFSGDVTTWGMPELVAGLFGMYALYSSFHQAKQHKYRWEAGKNRRTKSKAAKYRAKAKALEARLAAA